MPTNHHARSIEIAGGEMRRVLLALDSLQDLMALETAGEIAALLRADLQGLFVENIELLRLAQLPFIQEVSLSPSIVRRIETLQLERDLRAQAERARRLIAAEAQRRRIEWSFHIERGALTTALASQREIDIVVVGRPQLSPHIQTVVYRGDTVMTVFDGSDTGRRALQTAAYLAGHDTALLVVLPGAKPELRSEAEQLLATSGSHVHYLGLSDPSPPQLIAAGRRYHCRLMVLGGNVKQLMPLLQQASCPVALVR